MAEEPARTSPATSPLRAFLMNQLHLSQGTLLLIVAVIIGLAAGMTALTFEFSYHWLNSHVLQPILESEVYSSFIIIIPALGGLLVGLLMKLSGQEGRHEGVPEVIESVNLRAGLIRFWKAFVKTIAAVFTLGSGGSAGPEGPMVHMGSAIGSVGGRLLGSSEEHTKVMISCGAAAGLAAIFHAPITGVIFVLEVILVDFSIDTFIPIIAASITASAFARATWGRGALLPGSSYTFRSLWEVPLYIALGLLCAVASVLFIAIYRRVEEYGEKLNTPDFLKPAIGGLIVGLVAVEFPQILSDGYGTINTALIASLSLKLALGLIVLKLLMTAVTLGSGGSGGMFAPTLFIGAMTGTAFGSWVVAQFPQLGLNSGAFALVGMGAAMAGSLFAPVTAVIMIFEVTNNYFLILPLMIASIVSLAFARRFVRDSVYTLSLSRKGIHLHDGRDETLLRSMNVGDIMRRDFTPIRENWPMARVFEHLSKSPYSTLAVINDQEEYLGILPFETLRQLINENSLSWLVIAKELLFTEAATLQPGEDLREAMAKFAAQNISELPVLDSDGVVVGMLSRGDLLTAYNHALLRRTAGRMIFEQEPINFVPQLRDGMLSIGRFCQRLIPFFPSENRAAPEKSGAFQTEKSSETSRSA